MGSLAGDGAQRGGGIFHLTARASWLVQPRGGWSGSLWVSKTPEVKSTCPFSWSAVTSGHGSKIETHLCLDPKSRRSTRVKTGSPAKSFIPPVRRIHEINNWYKYCVCSPLSEVQTPTSPFAWIFYGIIIALIPSCQLTKKNVKKKEKVDVIFLHSTAIFDLSCLLW